MKETENPITLAICMYNAGRYIEQTLEHVLAQTLQTFDLLIVDDCSKDDSTTRVERYMKSHPHSYRLYRLPENHGIAYARQYALEHAETEYLVYVDSDDLPLPQLLEKEYSAIQRDQELTAVSSWLQFVDTNCNRLKGGLYIGDTTKESFMQRAQDGKRMFLPIQTLFRRADALRVGGFRLEGFPEGRPRYRDFCEDLDLWTRMSDLYAEGKYMLVLPEVLYLYRKAEGLSSNHFNMIIKMEYVKVNVRRRRVGQPELTFIEYMEGLPPQQLKTLRRDASVADDLRNGFFFFKEGRWRHGCWLIVRSLVKNPGYIWDKVICNSGLIKRKV
jgi:glycosyltransferase involved in cell wall biosynthesis